MSLLVRAVESTLGVGAAMGENGLGSGSKDDLIGDDGRTEVGLSSDDGSLGWRAKGLKEFWAGAWAATGSILACCGLWLISLSSCSRHPKSGIV